MEIHYQNENRLVEFENLISSLTDKSILLYNDFKIDGNCLTTTLLLNEKKGIFPSRIILTIKNIRNSNITRNFDLQEFMLVFGINFSDNKIYFSSLEESQGILGFEAELEVSSFDIHLSNDDFM